jgi:hypothetical protein
MPRVLRFVQVLGCCATLPLLAVTMYAQDGLEMPARATALQGGPQDWSNRHVIYTRNGSAEDLWKLRNDPRLLNSIMMHYMREHRAEIGQAAVARGSGVESDSVVGNEARREDGGGSGDPSENDLRAPHMPIFGPWPKSPTPPPARKRRKADWSYSMGPSAGMAPGESPAVYTANYSTPSCSNDFIVYTINATPSVGGQANLIGLNNLYSNGAGTGYCSGTGPSLLFSYAIGSGPSMLSPVLSLDGTRIAWIENRTATDAWLHVTIRANSQGSSATSPVAVNGTFSNGSCTVAGASCDFALDYTNATYPGCSTAYVAGNTHSDLYVDYASNSGYISANNGLLYHIKNMFSPTASPSVDFCVPANAAFESSPKPAMSGPIYDSLLGYALLTDSETVYVYKVNASSFTLAYTPYVYGNSGSNYNNPTGPGPLLDMFNTWLYVFSSYDAAGNTSVTQFSPASTAVVKLGPKSSNPTLFYGAFDNNYFTHGPKSALSTLYSCGTDSTTSTEQDLFAISFNPSTGVVNSTPAMSYNKNVGTAGLCSSLTEFYDGTTDRLFVGMGQPGATTGSNVVTMWNINSQLTNTSGSGGTMPTYTAEATGYEGGASGMSADNNDAGTSQAENVYFSTLESGTASTAVTGTGYNLNGIDPDGSSFSTGLDGTGDAYSATLLGTSLAWNGTTFTFGSETAGASNAWSNATVTLPSGIFNTLEILATGVNGNQTSQVFTVEYTDGSTTTFTQSLSDWGSQTAPYSNETVVKVMSYRNHDDGTEQSGPWRLYGYSFAINPAKTVSTLTLPANANVSVLAAALAPNCGGADYCAVKLTQSALQ